MERTRVRLSSIDLLPPEAEADVQWAIDEIEQGKRLQIDIHQEFNARLADRGIAPISHSAFSRYALRKRRAFARLREVREISRSLTQSMDPGADDDITVTIAQTIKTLVFELLEEGKLAPKATMELARALQATVSAQKISSDRRAKLTGDIKAKLGQAVDAAEAALADAGETPPDGKEVLRKIREEVYGIFDA